MNDLNRNMTYFQMPVRFSEGTGNGELYVFTNKKTLHNNPENVSALLHLDMEHLGSVDVYVKLAGKNVTTNFCLEDSETLDFVYDHIDRLNARLEALGYTAHFEMKLTQPQETIRAHGYTIRAFRVNHTVTCYGYSQIIERTGKFDVDRAKESQIPMKFWSRLQKGETIEEEGMVYTPDMVLGEQRKGIKVTYCTDTRPVDAIRKNAMHSDAL